MLSSSTSTENNPNDQHYYPAISTDQNFSISSSSNPSQTYSEPTSDQQMNFPSNLDTQLLESATRLNEVPLNKEIESDVNIQPESRSDEYFVDEEPSLTTNIPPSGEFFRLRKFHTTILYF